MKAKKIFATMLAISLLLPVTKTFNQEIIQCVNVQAEENLINGIQEDEYYEMINETICLVNDYRQSNGLEPFKTCDLLNEIATQRAKEQEITGMSHTRPDGSSCFTIYDDYSMDWSSLAENSASGQSTPESVVEAWKNSTYHNQNLLGYFEYIGIGVTYYNGVYYWIQLFCTTDDQRVTSTEYIPTRITQEKMLIKGDLNEDGKINVLDLLIMRKYILHLITEF